MSNTRAILAHLAAGLWAAQIAAAGELAVASVEPAAHSLTAPVAAPITVHFDLPVLPASIACDSFSAFGRWSGTVKLGDLDGDCAVTAFDLAILLGNWGPCPPAEPCPADLNGDGTVSAADLAQLIGHWGPCL